MTEQEFQLDESLPINACIYIMDDVTWQGHRKKPWHWWQIKIIKLFFGWEARNVKKF